MNSKVPTYEEFDSYTGLHCHRLWAEVGAAYVRPSCNRNKYQILRWVTRFPNKTNAFKGWVAVLHKHHDHSQESMSRNSGRFPETVICDQCNSSGGRVKRKLKLPKNFSFSPQEIRRFVKAIPHGAHEIDYDIAQAIYTEINSKRFVFWKEM